MDMENCVDIVRPFVRALDDEHFTNVQIFGGIGSAALGHPGAELLPEEKLVVVPGDLFLPRHRNDGNLRDLDCLVKSSRPEVKDNVEIIARETIDKDKLILSIFGLRPMSQLLRQIEHPSSSMAKVQVSDRYVEEDQNSVVAAKKALFPFAVDLPVEALETWRLQIGDDQLTFPIPNPAATALNYLTRSVSGLRPKDAQKVDALTRNIADKAPALIDWMTDGPGASQLDLARILLTLRQGRTDGKELRVGGLLTIKPYKLRELGRHQAFMFAGQTHLLRGFVEIKHGISHGLHTVEANQRIVSLFQKYIEPNIQSLVKNEL